MWSREVKAEWIRNAPALRLTLDGMDFPLILIPKESHAGSVGWTVNDKRTVGEHRCQITVYVTVIGSKEVSTSPSTENSTIKPTSGHGAENVKLPEAPPSPAKPRKGSKGQPKPSDAS